MEEPRYDERLGRALAFVAHEFRGKRRKATDVPYLGHLLSVTALVIEHGGDADQMVAAALHDYLEDIPGATMERIASEFGAEVARIVRALSDATDATNKAPWPERKRAYLAHIRGADGAIKLVCACDKLHNARSVVADQKRTGDAVFARFSASKDDTLWFYREVLVALREGWTHAVLDDLDETIDEMHRRAR